MPLASSCGTWLAVSHMDGFVCGLSKMEPGTLPMLGLGDALQFGLHQPAAGQVCCYPLWPHGFQCCRGLHRAAGKLIFQVQGSVGCELRVIVQRQRGLAQTPTRPNYGYFSKK